VTFHCENLKTMIKFTKWVEMYLPLLVILFSVAGMVITGKSSVSKAANVSVGTNVIQDNSSSQYQKGERSAKIWGCYDGCHAGAASSSKYIGPDISGIIQNYSRSDLQKLLREGKRPNGTEVTSMPASMFRFIKDDEIGPILSFLKQASTNQ